MLTIPIEGGPIHLASDYHVETPAGPALILRAGAMLGKPAAGFTHPNVLLKEPCVHEFKHYRKGGGKFWTAAAGYNFYFAIPKAAVRLHPEPGYSYIKAQVAGVEVVFNVSGGTLNGWTDWIRNPVSISVNHPLRALRQLADAALTPEAAASLGLSVEPKPLDSEQVLRFSEQVAINWPTLLHLAPPRQATYASRL